MLIYCILCALCSRKVRIRHVCCLNRHSNDIVIKPGTSWKSYDATANHHRSGNILNFQRLSFFPHFVLPLNFPLIYLRAASVYTLRIFPKHSNGIYLIISSVYLSPLLVHLFLSQFFLPLDF